MTIFNRRHATLVAAIAAILLVGASTASAQIVVRTATPTLRPAPLQPAFRPGVQGYYGTFPSTANLVNPNPYVAPGLRLNQWAYNTNVVGRAYSQFPPWMYGYNPYPTVVNYGPVYRQPYYPMPLYQNYPTTYGPYAQGTGAYNPYLNPYGVNPYLP